MNGESLGPTVVTWILIVFGWITCGPLLYVQLVVLLQPHGEKAKELIVGKGHEWRDHSHFKSAVALAWADWLLFMPILSAATLGVLLGRAWGLALFGAAGAIQLYIGLFLAFFERSTPFRRSGRWPITPTSGATLSTGARLR